jgi:hypothetical protein
MFPIVIYPITISLCYLLLMDAYCHNSHTKVTLTLWSVFSIYRPIYMISRKSLYLIDLITNSQKSHCITFPIFKETQKFNDCMCYHIYWNTGNSKRSSVYTMFTQLKKTISSLPRFLLHCLGDLPIVRRIPPEFRACPQ